MRFSSDLPTQGDPITEATTAIGSEPLMWSRRWDVSGVDVARWRISGPRRFQYGGQSRHMLTLVLRPLRRHLLTRNRSLVREGAVLPGRFRVATPGEEIGAEVAAADVIDMIQIYFSQEALERLADDLGLPDRAMPLVDPLWEWQDHEIETSMRLMSGQDRGESAQPDGPRLELLANFAFATFLRRSSSTEPREHARLRRSARVDRAIEFIEANFQRPIDLAEIAEAACLSPFHLCRSFHLATGGTPVAYLRERRLSEARVLLTQTNHGLEEIAFRVGFASGASLAGAVRRKFGVGPSELRTG